MKAFRVFKTSPDTLYCFTPFVSLLTFTIEILFTLYILIKYKSTNFNRLCAIALVCLGLFQLAQYEIYLNKSPIIWTKIGFIAITFLPALGINMITTIIKKHTSLVISAYIYAAALIAAILFIPEVALVATCQKNNVDFSSNIFFSILHIIYYSGYLFAGIYLLWNSIQKHIGDAYEEKWMLTSYIVFIAPPAILFIIHAISIAALPSVMCGFALLSAVIFVLFVIPRHYKVNRISKQK